MFTYIPRKTGFLGLTPHGKPLELRLLVSFSMAPLRGLLYSITVFEHRRVSQCQFCARARSKLSECNLERPMG